MSKRPALASTLLAATLVLAAVLTRPATAASVAEAVTYTGTLGGQAIVLELSDLEDGPSVGRYSYQTNGANIPLHGLSASQSDIVLAEELPCTPALCERPDGDNVLDPPLGGQFHLHYSVGGTKLTGTWRASDSDSVELPVELTRFGQRSYDLEADSPYFYFSWMNYGGVAITPETSPYDYAKMQVALTEGPLKTLYGATYRG